jgi:lipoprotein-anchoring transpeptidase ErfK/SrfK
MRAIRPLLATAVAAAALGACGGGGPSAPEGRPSEPTSVTVAAEPDAPVVEATELRPVDGLVAATRGDLAIYSSPGSETPPTSTLPAHTQFGSRTVVGVVAWQGVDGEWLEVSLPVRPNGSRGFIRAADVDLTRVELAVDVDLAAMTLRVHGRNGAVVLETAVAIGSPEYPTPTGKFFVTDVVETGNDESSYGPVALGTSAHAVLTEFAGGDGQVGIHGTNQPGSIGEAVSHGCVRVPNDVVVQLAAILPLGAPVTIH